MYANWTFSLPKQQSYIKKLSINLRNDTYMRLLIIFHVLANSVLSCIVKHTCHYFITHSLDAETIHYGSMIDHDSTLNDQPTSQLFLKINDVIMQDGRLVAWEFNAIAEGLITLQVNILK